MIVPNPAFGTTVDFIEKIASNQAIWRKYWRKFTEAAC